MNNLPVESTYFILYTYSSSSLNNLQNFLAREETKDTLMCARGWHSW